MKKYNQQQPPIVQDRHQAGGVATLRADRSEPLQRRENKTGMPDQLKSGVEALSSLDRSDVRVHYNSDRPAQLQAHAYAQGTDIHIARGQERHLPHEAWHVVQQKEGRVRPTDQLKAKVNINDDNGLEREADVMGGKAKNLSIKPVHKIQRIGLDNYNQIKEPTIQHREAMTGMPKNFKVGAAVIPDMGPAQLQAHTYEMGNGVIQRLEIHVLQTN